MLQKTVTEYKDDIFYNRCHLTVPMCLVPRVDELKLAQIPVSKYGILKGRKQFAVADFTHD
jgi:hypothetical protein